MINSKNIFTYIDELERTNEINKSIISKLEKDLYTTQEKNKTVELKLKNSFKVPKNYVHQYDIIKAIEKTLLLKDLKTDKGTLLEIFYKILNEHE